MSRATVVHAEAGWLTGDRALSPQLRQNLDGLLNQLKNFPARLRQYASYEFVQRLLKGYLKVGDWRCTRGAGGPLGSAAPGDLLALPRSTCW